MAPLAHCWCQQFLCASSYGSPERLKYSHQNHIIFHQIMYTLHWLKNKSRDSFQQFCVWIINHIIISIYDIHYICNRFYATGEVPEILDWWFWPNVISGCLSRASYMWPKANLLYCIVFLCYISSMHELATHKSLFCSLYPAKLTLTWYSPLFKWPLTAKTHPAGSWSINGTADEMTLRVSKTPSANLRTESAQVCSLCWVTVFQDLLMQKCTRALKQKGSDVIKAVCGLAYSILII